MIPHIRRRFICFTMCILTAAVLLPMIALNVIPNVMTYNQNRSTLQQAVENEIRIRTVDDKKDEKPDEKPNDKPPDAAAPAMESDSQTTTTAVTTAQTTTSVSLSQETETVITTAATVSQAATEGVTPKQQQHTEAAAPQTSVAVTSTEKNVQHTTRAVTTAKATKPTTTEAVQTQPEEDDDADWGDGDWYGPDYDDTPWHPHPWDAAIKLSSLSYSRTIAQKVEHIPNKTETNNDCILVVLNKENDLIETIQADWYDYTDEEILSFVAKVQASDKQDGYCDTLQYYAEPYDQGEIVAFIDRSRSISFLKQLLLISIIIFVLMEAIVFFLTMMLTKRAMLPMQISFEKQKQFISDAGHELKTPLTIISANTDILQDEIGENKWLNYIRMQTERMRVLIDEMMTLTKMEHVNQVAVQERFNLSSAVETMALPFESQAFEQKKTFCINVTPDLYFHGDPEQIRRMIGILIDNAFKYSADQGEIRVSLQEEAGNRMVLQVYNTGKGIRPDEKEKIFERFYRSDSSRARSTGGYGLGLSIAKSVAEAHKIKIEVTCEEEQWICFTLSFPAQKK